MTIASKWNKWDLHVHTPDTILNNNYENGSSDQGWEKFLLELESRSDLKVIGVTEYFSISPYLKLLDFKRQDRIPNIELLLPNVEVRIFPVTDKNRPINFHFIFSPEIVSDLESLFFSRLVFEYKGNPFRCVRTDLINLGKAFKNDKTLVDGVAYREGIGQFRITRNQISEVLSGSERLRKHCICGVANSNNDGNSGIKESGLAAERQEIYRLTDFILSGNPNDKEYFLGKGVDTAEAIIENCGSLKPCIHGSDAHELTKVGRPDLDRNTYIKGEVSFDGLRQILYEPEYRVLISSNCPIDPIFRIETLSLSFPEDTLLRNEQFCLSGNHKIEFSSNYTCLIGGRGTGKSTILNLIHERLNPGRNEFFKKNVLTNGLGSSISINDYISVDDNEPAVEIEFLGQNQIEEFALDHSRLTNSIYRKILEQQEDSALHDCENTLRMVVKERFDALEKMQYLNAKKKERSRLSDELRANEKIFDILSGQEFKELSKEFNDSKELYEFVADRRNEYRKLVDELTRIISYNQSNSADYYSDQIDRIKQEIETLIRIDESAEEEADDKISDMLLKLESIKDRIKDFLSRNGLSEEQVKLFNQTIQRIEEKKKLIQNCDQIILELTEGISKIDKERLPAAHNSFKTSLNNEINKINETLSAIRNQSVKNIRIEFVTDIEKRWERIFETFNKLFSSELQANYQKNILEQILRNAIDKINTEIEFQNAIRSYETTSKAKFELTNIFDRKANYELFREAVQIHDLDTIESMKLDVYYDQRLLENSSFGQRCTAVLVLLLILGSRPLIIDEPEAHLDSMLISNYLVELIKRRKVQRQLIIATHNANFVINGDADLVNILEVNENSGLTTITPTTIENFLTRGRLISLEGGKEAFRKRETKYQLS